MGVRGRVKGTCRFTRTHIWWWVVRVKGMCEMSVMGNGLGESGI